MNISPSPKKKKVAGVCSAWLRGRDPSMTVSAFQSLWCHGDVMASVQGIDGQLDLQVLFFFFSFFLFLGYRGIAYSLPARSCRRRQTNLICARIAA